jgi:hypothetical protein
MDISIRRAEFALTVSRYPIDFFSNMSMFIIFYCMSFNLRVTGQSDFQAGVRLFPQAAATSIRSVNAGLGYAVD